MDMKRYKKLAIPKIESSEMVKNVRDTLKAYKHAKQDVYERISEELKPLTDKIDKEITEISELNQEVTKQSEATQRALKGFTEEMKALPTPDQRETETKGSVDFYKGFSVDELEIYEKYGLPLPPKVYEETKKDPNFFKNIYSETRELNNSLGRKKGKVSFRNVTAHVQHVVT